MHRTLANAVLLSSVLVFAFTSRCQAETYVEFDHEWTIQTSSGTYGLEGIGSISYLRWGWSYLRIPVHPYALVAALVIGMLLLLVLSWLAVGAFVRQRPRASC